MATTAHGIPVRLSAALTMRARSASHAADRSLTDQVEHWARLGQVVEAAISAGTTELLKLRSHDPELGQRLEAARTDAGRARAAALIAGRDPVRHGVDGRGQPVRVTRGRTARSRP